jgi:hypothetical protein
MDGRTTNDYGIFNENNHFGTVKKDYTILQNNYLADIIYEAAQRINTDIDISRASSKVFNDGKNAVIQLPLPDSIIKANKFGGGDTINRHLTIMNSFDGKSSVGFGTLNTVMSCENQFRYMYKNISNKFKHSSRLEQNINNAMSLMIRIINADLELFQTFEEMRKIAVTQDNINDIVFSALNLDKRFLTEKEVNGKELSTRMENKIYGFNTAMRKELVAKGNTLWGAFNGVTYYYNHIEKKSVYDNTSTLATNRALDTAIKLLHTV